MKANAASLDKGEPMNIHTLDKINSHASATKEKHMNKSKRNHVTHPHKKTVTRTARVAMWVRHLFAKALAKGKKALAWARAKVKAAYGKASVECRAAMNYMTAKLKTVTVAAKAYAVALNERLGNPYEVISEGVSAYVVPVVKGVRQVGRIAGLVMVPMVGFIAGVVAPVGTAIVLGTGLVGLAVMKLLCLQNQELEARVVRVLAVAGKAIGYVLEAAGTLFVVGTIVAGTLPSKILMAACVAMESVFAYGEQKEAAQEEAFAPFGRAYPNFAPTTNLVHS